jgi:hypothetical protein
MCRDCKPGQQLTRRLPSGAATYCPDRCLFCGIHRDVRCGSCLPAGNMCCHTSPGSTELLTTMCCSALLGVRAEYAAAGGASASPASKQLARARRVNCCRGCRWDSSCAAPAPPPSTGHIITLRCCSFALSDNTPGLIPHHPSSKCVRWQAPDSMLLLIVNKPGPGSSGESAESQPSRRSTRRVLQGL